MAARPHAVDATTTSPPKAPAIFMGLGLGGFVDGILLHQILQWHHMLTDTGEHPATTVEGLETNTLVDGLFHAATWIFVVTGMLLALRAWQRRELAPPWRGQLGLLFIGWGVFNLVEGVVDHHILGIHHVRDDLGAPLGWDLAFLGLGALLVIAGVALVRSAERIAGEHSAKQAARAAGSR